MNDCGLDYAEGMEVQECLCEDEEWDILTGVATCDACGRRRFLTAGDYRFEAEAQARWDKFCEENPSDDSMGEAASAPMSDDEIPF